MSESSWIKPLILSGFSSQDWASEIATSLGSKLAKVSYKEHADGEINTTLEGNVRGREVVVIASGSGDPNTQEKEARLLMRSARQGGAKAITLVVPYMFYGRSDSNFDSRSAPAVVDSIETMRQFCDDVLVADPHNHGLTSQTFLASGSPVRSCTTAHFAFPFAIQLNHLFNEKAIDKDRLLLTHPDVGASKRITRSFRECLYGVLDLPYNPERSDEWAQVIKSRDHKTGNINVSINADVKGKDIVIFEDMIASGGTACDIAQLLKDRGAKTVILFATSGLFTTKKKTPVTSTIDRINKSALDAVFITDTYDHRRTHRAVHQAIEKSPIIHTISTSSYVAHMIGAIHMQVTSETSEQTNSISALLRGKHPLQILPDQIIARPTPIKARSPLAL